MAIERKNYRAEEYIEALQKEHMKTHCVRDNSERVIILYEAPASVEHGVPCLATIYEYTTTSNVPTNTLERMAQWDSAWDAGTKATLVNGLPGYTE